VAEKKAVVAPTNVITDRTVGTYSNRGEHFIIKKTPAVTIVAAWINADTGVGPSIASGNHVWRPIWADLPMAPINNKEQINVNTGKSYPKKTSVDLTKKGANGKTIWKSKDLNTKKIETIPIVKAKSATRFTTRALMAALFACKRVYQKLIKRYEQSPTPSQPRNKITKLSPVTNVNIKKVNNDKYDIKRGKWGSCDM
jgi:hypothetical protein